MIALNDCGLTLSAGKTIICPRSTTILGWIWTQRRLSASPHKVSVLSTCKLPDTVHVLRSFIGAYKMLSRVLPSCAHAIAPLEGAISGLQSKDKIKWSEELIENFNTAQWQLKDSKEIYLPRRVDHLWIITDGSVSKWSDSIHNAWWQNPSRWILQCQITKASSNMAPMRNWSIVYICCHKTF